MPSGRLAVSVVKIVVGVLVAAASLRASSPMERLTYLAFHRPVALPGVTLAAGVYDFQIADPLGSGNIVCVSNRGRTTLSFVGTTVRIDRPAGFRGDGCSVLLGEATDLEPPPILAWFPAHESHGRKFVYPETYCAERHRKERGGFLLSAWLIRSVEMVRRESSALDTCRPRFIAHSSDSTLASFVTAAKRTTLARSGAPTQVHTYGTDQIACLPELQPLTLRFASR
jgi:hypothetical protein